MFVERPLFQVFSTSERSHIADMCYQKAMTCDLSEVVLFLHSIDLQRLDLSEVV